MKKIFNKVYYLIISGTLLLQFNLVKATNTMIDNPLGDTTTLSQLIDEILNVIITIATPLAILAVIYAGFLFVKAQGDTTKLQEARTMLIWTVVGIMVLLGATLLSSVISGTITDLGVGV